MTTIVDGVTFYTGEEARDRAYAKIRKDAKEIASRYHGSEILSAK